MYYYKKEDQDKEARKTIEELKRCAGIFQKIRPIITRFDGKIYNCRFDKALIESGEQLFIEKRFSYFAIYTFCNYDQRNIAIVDKKDMPDGKRIPADKLIASAREIRAEMLRDAESIQQAMIQSEEIQKQLKQLERAMHALTDHFCSEARHIYGLNVKINFGS